MDENIDSVVALIPVSNLYHQLRVSIKNFVNLASESIMETNNV